MVFISTHSKSHPNFLGEEGGEWGQEVEWVCLDKMPARLNCIFKHGGFGVLYLWFIKVGNRKSLFYYQKKTFLFIVTQSNKIRYTGLTPQNYSSNNIQIRVTHYKEKKILIIKICFSPITREKEASLIYVYPMTIQRVKY